MHCYNYSNCDTQIKHVAYYMGAKTQQTIAICTVATVDDMKKNSVLKKVNKDLKRLCIFSRSLVWEFVVYFAGHRTTYSKELRIIQELRTFCPH